MQNKAEEKQVQIYKKMSAEKKIKILDDFYRFARVLKNDNPKISRTNKPSLRRA